MASFGARLKKEREQRGVSLEDVAQSTKIGTRMLRALEQEQLDQLPGGIFNKGFIRAYAHFLGIDEEEVIAEYAAATGTGQPAQKAEEREQFPLEDVKTQIEKENSESLPWGTFAAILVIAALLFAIWGVYSREKQNKATKPAVSGQSQSVPQSEMAPAVMAENAVPRTVSVSDPATATGPAAEGKISAASAIPSTAPPGAPSAAGVSHAAAGDAGGIRVTVKAREDSWIAITVDGEVTMRGTLAAGSVKNIRAAREVEIKAGNAGALEFAFNGKALPPQGAAGEVKSLTFDANGIEAPVAAPATQP